MVDYTPPGTGERYNTPTKNCVRSHWVAFAAGGIDPERLASRRFLMFPGPMALESTALRERGIDLKNCQGVERDCPAANRIAAAVPDLPLARTTMEQFLTLHDLKRGEPFDAVWLDYDGKFHTHRSEIIAALANVRQANGSCFGVTTFQGRDRDTIIETGVAISLLKSCMKPEFFQRLVDTISGQYAPNGLPTDDNDLGTHYNMVARELNAIAVLLYGLGSAERGLAFTKPVESAMTKIRGMCGKTFRQRDTHGTRNLPFPLFTSLAFPRVFHETMVSLWPVDCMRFSYTFAPERLHSWFVRFETDAVPRSLADVLVQTQQLWIERPIHLLDGTATPIVPVPFCPYCDGAARSTPLPQTPSRTPEPPSAPLERKEKSMRTRQRRATAPTKKSFTDREREQVLRDYDRLGAERTQSKWQRKGYRRQQIAGIQAAAKRSR